LPDLACTRYAWSSYHTGGANAVHYLPNGIANDPSPAKL
jgi:hypothetical protein